MKDLDINCCVDGCERKANYRSKALCQKHYFRLMRNGHFTLQERKRAERTRNKKGYQMLFKPNHALSMKNGYVYEHRYVIYSIYGEVIPNCQFCGKQVTWKNCHIDHVDNNVKNNSKGNLRVLCNACNVMRARVLIPSHTIKSHISVTYKNVTKTPHEWARHEGVTVSSNTIIRRLSNGFSVKDALFGEKMTHKHTKSKVSQTKFKNIHA